jgi:hypothetical protein
MERGRAGGRARWVGKREEKNGRRRRGFDRDEFLNSTTSVKFREGKQTREKLARADQTSRLRGILNTSAMGNIRLPNLLVKILIKN